MFLLYSSLLLPSMQQHPLGTQPCDVNPRQGFLLRQGGRREWEEEEEEEEERNEEWEHYPLGRTLAEWELKWNGSPWERDRGRERNGVGLLASLICLVKTKKRERERGRGGRKWKSEGHREDSETGLFARFGVEDDEEVVARGHDGVFTSMALA